MAMPTFFDIREYLMFNAGCCGEDVSDEHILDTYDAEIAAQAAVCRIPDPMPNDLAEALRRRVAHNFTLQMLATEKSFSLAEAAIATGQAGELDPLVRRLEAPYRRLPIA